MAKDLTKNCGKRFGLSHLKNFRKFYLSYFHIQKSQTLSDFFKSSQKGQTVSAQSFNSLKIQRQCSNLFPLPWSAYVRLLSIENESARKFYEDESLRGAWSVRQLDRQMSSQLYIRTLLSKNK